MPLKWFHTYNDAVTVSVQQNVPDGQNTLQTVISFPSDLQNQPAQKNNFARLSFMVAKNLILQLLCKIATHFQFKGTSQTVFWIMDHFPHWPC